MDHKILPFVSEVAYSTALCVPDDPCVSRPISQPKSSCLLLPGRGLSERNDEMRNLKEMFSGRSDADLESVLSNSASLPEAIDILLKKMMKSTMKVGQNFCQTVCILPLL